MRFDVENQLSVTQVFTGAATVSQNSYMKQTAAQDISIGRRIAALFCPSVAATSAVTVEVIQADDAALSVNVTSLASVTIPQVKAIPGVQSEIPVPQGVLSQQFLGARVTGSVTADIYLVPQDEDILDKRFPYINPALV